MSVTQIAQPDPYEVLDFDGSQFCVLGPATEAGRKTLLGTCTGPNAQATAHLFAAAPRMRAFVRLIAMMEIDHGVILTRQTIEDARDITAQLDLLSPECEREGGRS